MSKLISIKKKHTSTGAFHNFFSIRAIGFMVPLLCSLRQQQQQEEFEALRKLESLSHALDCRIYEYEDRFASLKHREGLVQSHELLLKEFEQRLSDNDRESERCKERAAEEARHEQRRLQADLLQLQHHLEERQNQVELMEQKLFVQSEIGRSASCRQVLPSPQTSPYAAQQTSVTALDLDTRKIELASSSARPNHASPAAASFASQSPFSSPYPVVSNVSLYPDSVTATAAFLNPSLVQIPSRHVGSQLPLDSFLSPQRGDLFSFAASPAMTPNTFGKAIRRVA
jgi:hypothetical protein